VAGITILLYRFLRRNRAPVFTIDDRELAVMRLEQELADYRFIRCALP
jgi:hypothetical protein